LPLAIDHGNYARYTFGVARYAATLEGVEKAQDGEARARQVADDLFEARMIATSVQHRRGRKLDSHRLSEPPEAVVWVKDARPVFSYRRPIECFSVIGSPSDGFRLLETRAAGSLVVHKAYGWDGAVLDEKRELSYGDPTRN
jgi:hypothetical protein